MRDARRSTEMSARVFAAADRSAGFSCYRSSGLTTNLTAEKVNGGLSKANQIQRPDAGD